MARLPAVLGTDDLPLAELCAARIDGELFHIDDAWAPIDEPDLPSLRAAVVARRAPRALIIERLSAAWVHGALDAPPEVAQFCVPHEARVAVVSARAAVVREVSIGDDEIVRHDGIACTDDVRTAFDLLRDPTIGDEPVEQVLARMIAARDGFAGRVRDRLADAHRLPHRARALERLGRAETAVRVEGRLRAEFAREPSSARFGRR
ncbi:hypothetical protein PX701_16365 [Agromyces sp. H3Y2-19a]|uniref:hypothetical protein n=1 Tax=Agromyces TaxID=33877 RepID=UPI0023B9910E|nr:hypothetical protein [Agromyces chromiiresistens]MDF0515202.1 hypothetical protein [Agromyces chromiiresistens]